MLFDRIVRVDIGPPGGIGTRFEDIRIAFRGEKSRARSANKCEIDLYNISQDTVTQIIDDDNILVLSVGYAEDKGLQFLFSGDITRVIPVYEPPDRITRIECFDGLKKLQQTRIKLGYAPGVSADTLIRKIVRKLGLPLAENYSPIRSKFSNGFNYVGEAKKALSIVLDRVGKEWSIQNGAILIVDDANESTRKEIALLSPFSGLIGVPENLDERAGRLADIKRRKKRKQKYKFTTLLRPELGIYDKVQIASETVRGVYKVRKHEYEGDNFGGEWLSTLETREV
jgi:hypothetical protein